MLRRNTSDKRNIDQSVYPIIQCDILGNSTDKDMHYERIGGMGVKKYLRENCYHRIECSIANSLTALMRK